jgi:hypothetical protein
MARRLMICPSDEDSVGICMRVLPFLAIIVWIITVQACFYVILHRSTAQHAEARSPGTQCLALGGTNTENSTHVTCFLLL